jgi:hypothetical protein
MTRVRVKPEILRWACVRSRIDEPELSERFPKLDAWFRGETQPTLKQLETFAKATHVPFGYLFLPYPPDEPLPIADFRERSPGPPSGDLPDTVYAAQRRQDWFSGYATRDRLDAIDWIGTANLDQKPSVVAARLRERLAFEPAQRKEHANWETAARALLERVQALGVLVSVNGVVGSNTRRRLDPAEVSRWSTRWRPTCSSTARTTRRRMHLRSATSWLTSRSDVRASPMKTSANFDTSRSRRGAMPLRRRSWRRRSSCAPFATRDRYRDPPKT